MNNIYEYYDDMADISILTGEAINTLEYLVKTKIQEALCRINDVKKHGGDTAISPVSNVTINDVHRNLLFFELLLNQTCGVTNTLAFQELLELTNYSINKEES